MNAQDAPTPPGSPLLDEADFAPLVEWLRDHDLTLPAWALLECVRPFGWLLSQMCLVLEPTARGFGFDHAIRSAISALESPECLAALSDALAPDREG